MVHYCFCLVMLVAVAFTDESSALTACNQFPKLQVGTDEMVELVANQPYITFWSSWPIFKCSEMAYVPPQTGKTGYNLTNIVTAGPIAVYFNVLLQDNVWEAVHCTIGVKVSFHNIYYDFKGTNKALCVASCGLDGITYQYVVCIGKTQHDRNKLNQFLIANQIPAVIDSQLGCNIKEKVCAVANNQAFLISNLG